MADRPRVVPVPIPGKRLPSIRVSRSAIRRYVRSLVDRFRPERVILFGSHAYGRPHADSDVDLIVVASVRSMSEMAVRMRVQRPAPCPMHLVVYTPEFLEKRWVMGDWLVREALEKGVVLHDASDA